MLVCVFTRSCIVGKMVSKEMTVINWKPEFIPKIDSECTKDYMGKIGNERNKQEGSIWTIALKKIRTLVPMKYMSWKK